MIEGYCELYDCRPSTVSEKRKWQKELDATEEKILTLYGTLNNRLVSQEEEARKTAAGAPPGSKREEIKTSEEVHPPEKGTACAEPVTQPEAREGTAGAAVGAAAEEVQVREEAEKTTPAAGEETQATSDEEVPPYKAEEVSATGEEAETLEQAEPSAAEEAHVTGKEAHYQEKRPVEEGAVILQQETERVNRVLVSCLDMGDILAAYWLAWGMEHLGLRPIIRSPLIKAVQGALWTMRAWPEQPVRVVQELREIPQQTAPGKDEAEKLIGCAAALYLALVAPADGWGDWLPVRSDLIPSLPELGKVIRSSAVWGWSLQPADVEGVKGREEREYAIRELAREARNWLEAAQNRRTTYQRASVVWHRMVSSGGRLHNWFQVVVGDERDRVGEIRELLEKWRRTSWVDEQIQETCAELTGRRVVRIEGRARRQLIRWAEEACDIAERWMQAVLRERKFAGQEEWIQKQVRTLLNEFTRLIPEVQGQIDEAIECLGDGRAEKAALRLLQRSVISMGRIFLSSDEPMPHSKYDPPIENLRECSLEENLICRLFWLPEVSLDMGEVGPPRVADGSVEKLVLALMTPTSRDRPAEEAVEGWLSRRDYRFVDFLLPELSPEWEDRYAEALRSDLSALRREIEETEAAVEQALIDGLISEKERDTYIGSVEAVRKSLSRVEKAPEEHKLLLNLNALASRLGNVRKELEKKREVRLEGQRKRWASLRREMPKAFSKDLVEIIQQVVQLSLDRGEIRAVDEYLAHLEDSLRGGKRLAESIFYAHGRDPLSEFVEAIAPLSKYLETHPISEIVRRAQRGALPTELGAPRLPAPRVKEITKALIAWSSLKKASRQGHDEAAFQHVVTLMKYLGFQVEGRSPISLVSTQPGMRHWRVAASPEVSRLVPVPQFGSDRNGQYDVIGVWDRPGFTLMGAQLQRAVDRPAILLYFGRLLRRQREDLTRIARNQAIPVLIVDEILLLFLAREYDVRLGTFFNCTLPFTALNPYVPFAAGVVPPEMFVGRQKMIEQLLDPLGPAIVYGGRQLGKSALLRQVWRRFHDPENGRFAILEDIKLVGDPRMDPTSEGYEKIFWSRLLNALNQVGFLKLPPNTSPEKIQQRILRQIKENDSKLMLLLDEADNFLEADAAREFPVVSALKTLMDQTDRRFKVIIAGLHNVQRFQRIPNQPLAHLGTPIEVGPLEPEAAQELLERPLRALGYRLGSDTANRSSSVLLHILSYTNYHPGLIQLFGRELVEHLRAARRSRLPPFTITRQDVEAVYRRSDVREAIRQRFSWTLALDERYEAIALAMILEQWDARDGFDRLYTPREIYELASYWWPAGFAEVDMDRFRGYLDEMRGLGVLTYAEDGRYRLRSPNVVQMMGTYDELFGRMIEIGAKEPPASLKIESHHPPLAESVYSPLSYAQASALRGSRAGVGMVFGSEALGIGRLKEATTHFVESKEAWEEIRIPAKTGVALTQWLSEHSSRRASYSFLLFYRDLETWGGMPAQLEEQVRAAVKFCARCRRAVRVIFALGPWAAWQWFQLPADRRDEMEEQVGAIVALRRWDQTGIQQRLEQHKPEMMATERNCRKILEVTGGWPFLLDNFLQRCQTDDPLPELEQFERELRDPHSKIHTRFLELLSVPEGLPSRFVRAMRAEQAKQQQREDYWIPRDIAYLLLEDEDPQQVDIAIDYLVRTSVLRQRELGSKRDEGNLTREISLDPIVFRLWKE